MTIVDRKHQETIQGTEWGLTSPGSEPLPTLYSQLPLHPSDNLPSSKRSSPPACSLTGSKGQKGTEPRSSNQTAHRRALPVSWILGATSWAQCCCPHGCYRGTLGGCLDLSCSFCKMGARWVPSGVAVSGLTCFRERAGNRVWPKARAHEQ